MGCCNDREHMPIIQDVLGDNEMPEMDTMIPKSVGQDITDNETEAKKSKQEI